MKKENVIKNNIYFWVNLKMSFYFSVILCCGTLLIGYLFYELYFNRINFLKFFMTLLIFSLGGSALLFCCQVVGSMHAYGPRHIKLRSNNIVLYFSKNKIKSISWEYVYGLVEKEDIYMPSSFLKFKKIKEYRVYYYERDKLKWFCVSEEVGKRIQEMWEEWKRKNLKI